MKIVETITIECDDCLGFYIDLECLIYKDKSFKYRIRKEFYKYDQPEFEDEFFDTQEEALKKFELIIKEDEE